jgi:hypothetical protein
VNTEREHLDAETVAAWIDGGLDGPSIAAAEAHASNCERCQALLATVTRTLPPEAAPRTGGAPAWRWWLAPLAATAAAVTVWMVVPRQPAPSPPAPAPQAEIAQAPRPAAESAAPPPPVAAPPPQGARVGELRSEAPRKAEEAKQKTALADAQATTADAARRRERQEQAPAALQESVTVEAAPAAPAPSAAVGAVSQSRQQAALLELASPNPSYRWRVTEALVEFTQDGGRTWVPVRINAGTTVVAGASPSPLVCWLVGRRGLVLLATDGTNFTPLPFPEGADLIAVSATDARRATVTTADGRIYRTEDNGRNWRQ